MKMKKMLSAFLAVIMMCTLCPAAFAAEYDPAADDFCIDGVTVTVTYKEKDEQSATPTEVLPVKDARIVTWNLGTTGSRSFTWTVSSEGNRRSDYNYKTNSEQMIVRMTAGEQSTYVTLKCFNTNGTEIFAKTIDVWTWWNAEFKITGLSNSYSYYFVLYNNDQHTETFTGTISAT